MDALASAMLGATVLAAASVVLNGFSAFLPVWSLTKNYSRWARRADFKLLDMQECCRLELRLQAPAGMLE